MRRIISTLCFSLLSVLIVVGCQSAIQKANDYLHSPATTHPGTQPTHEDVIKDTTSVVSTVVPQPYGGLIGGLVTAGLLVLHNLDSRNRTNKGEAKIEDLADQVSDLVITVTDLSNQLKKDNTSPQK